MVTEPEDHSTSLSENSNQWTVPFRVILNAFVVLLIFTTGLTIGAVYYFNTVSIVDRISTDFFKVLSKNSIERTQQHFETAQSVNRLNTRLATQGLINPQDYKKLGNHFVQVLRTYPELTIAAYGGQDGMSLLAYRQSSSRIEIHLWEQRDDHTLFRRFRVDDQGDWSLSDPFSTERLTGEDRFDPRERPWYRRAAKEKESIWTQPYLWSPQNVLGITHGSPVTDDSGEVTGVFTIDFKLGFLKEALIDLKEPELKKFFLLDDQGNLIADSSEAESGGDTVPREVSDTPVAHVSSHSDPTYSSVNDLLNKHKEQVGSGGISLNKTVNGEDSKVIIEPLKLSDDQTWYISAVVPTSNLLTDVNKLARYAAFISLGIILVALLLGLFLSEAIKKPLGLLFEEIRSLGQFEIDKSTSTHSYINEINMIADALDRTKSSLRSFEKFVPAQLARKLQGRNVEADLGGDKKKISILFCDLVDSSGLAKTLKPNEFVSTMGYFLKEISKVIQEHDGTVDKFIGDEVMAFWGGLEECENHHERCVRSALSCRRKIDELNLETDQIGHQIRIGLNSGRAVVGNMGSEKRMNYTIMGTSVNIASRLEGLNRDYETSILMTEFTERHLGDDILRRRIDRVELESRETPFVIYEPICLMEKATQSQRALVECYEEGLDYYFKEEWRKAIDTFERCLEFERGDGPTKVMIDRISSFLKDPPTNWNGYSKPT